MGAHDRAKTYVESWVSKGYEGDIPDSAPPELESIGIVPSYRLIAKALLSNDINLLSLGFVAKKSKYYSILKKIEKEKIIVDIRCKHY